MSTRPWSEIATRIHQSIGEQHDRNCCMRIFLDAAWPLLQPTGVSWIGFYQADFLKPHTTSMILAQREPKPACSPIGLHGACGSAFKSGQPMVVHNVADLGGDYIACDPRDQSELVIPCFDVSENVWGVLDLDSFDIGSFTMQDAQQIALLLKWARLSTHFSIEAPLKN